MSTTKKKKKSANTKNKIKIVVLPREDTQSPLQHREESIYKTFLIKLTVHFNRKSGGKKKKKKGQPWVDADTDFIWEQLPFLWKSHCFTELC